MEDRIRDWNQDGPLVPSGSWGISSSVLANIQDYAPENDDYLTSLSWYKRDTKTTVDRVTPGWNRLKNEGRIVNNPFRSQHNQSDVSKPAAFSQLFKVGSTYTKKGGIWRQSVPAFISLDAETRASMRDQAINLATTSAHANINQEEILALCTIAESRKTVDSVVAISSKAYKIFRHVRRLNFRALRRELKPAELAQRWMEARYAIRPLAYDLKGIYDSFEKERKTIRKTYRGYNVQEWKDSDTLTDIANGFALSASTFKRESVYRVTARAGVLCDADVTYQSITGANKLFETAWELIPFSFVCDWFANVGDYIAAHTPDAGVRQLASWCSVVEEYDRSLSSVSTRSTAEDNGGVTLKHNIPPISYRNTELVRERIVDPQMSMFPSSKLTMDMFKLTDLGIMLRRVFK